MLFQSHGEICSTNTLPETNIAPENGWLEDYFPFGKRYFQGQTVSFGESMNPNQSNVFMLELLKVRNMGVSLNGGTPISLIT